MTNQEASGFQRDDDNNDEKIPYDAEFNMIDDAVYKIIDGLHNDKTINKDMLNFETFYHYLIYKLIYKIEFVTQLGIHKFGVDPKKIEQTISEAKEDITREVIELRKQDTLDNEIEYRQKYGGYRDSRTMQTLRRELTKANRVYHGEDSKT